MCLRSNMDSKYNNTRVINAGFADTDINTITRLFKEKVATMKATLVLFMPEFEVSAMPSEAELANYKACLTDAVNTAKANGSEIGFVTPPAKGDERVMIQLTNLGLSRVIEMAAIMLATVSFCWI